MTAAGLHFWDPSPPPPTVPADSIRVWQITLDDWGAQLAELQALLSSPEQARADRYVREKDRRRYTIVHGVLRRLIGRLTGQPPADLQFRQTAKGKPYLAQDEGSCSALRFSLSDSAGVALFAVAGACEVGVDVEKIRPINHLELAERFFAEEEIRSLKELPEEQRSDAFFACWTRKEAYLKAIGTGLLTPLDSFAVSLDRGGDSRLLRTPADQQDRWQLRDLRPGQGYAGALVTEGNARPVLMATLTPGSLRG